MPLKILAGSTYLRDSAGIDIVAVHDILTPVAHGCNNNRTSFAWLQHLFPHRHYGCRVLTYEYDGELSLTSESDHRDSLDNIAVTLAKDLATDRRHHGIPARPLIFIGHGVGGILVKLALCFASSQSLPSSVDCHSLFSSTYGIIFAGTPHYGIENDALKVLHPGAASHPSQFMLNLLANSLTISDIAGRFEPVMHNFRIHNIWEELTTHSGRFNEYVVRDWSAAPKDWPGERSGMAVRHADMLNFNDDESPGYLIVLNSIERFVQGIRYRNSTVSKSRADDPYAQITNQRQLSHHGHVLEQGFISGGNVHLGDVYINNAPQNERLTTLPQQDQNGPSPSDSTTSSRLYIVPRSSTPQFTGRQLLGEMVKKNLNTAIQDSTYPHPKIIVIHGLGGSGKTQFCLRYAERNQSSYWGIFWIDMSTKENAEADFGALGMQAGKGNTFSAGKHWLSRQNQPWLLVLDNADDENLEISEYIPPGAYGHVLVTTRNRNLTMFANAGSFRLQGMDPEEAICLLLKTAYPCEQTIETTSNHRTLASHIAAELGYLAIALDHAGATIRRKIYTIERYLQIYLGYRHRLLNSTRLISADETNIITTWEIPFQKIEQRQSVEHKDAVTLMHIFAYLHCSAIPESMFHILWSASEEHLCSPIEFPSLLRLDSTNPDEARVRLRRAISVLHDYSIIEHDAKRELCSLHPVVHRWARTRSLDRQDLVYWLDCTIELLARCISPYLEASGRQFRRLLLPHIESCLHLFQTESPLQLRSCERTNQLERFALVYAENGIWKPALSLLVKVTDYRTRALGTWHEHTLRALQGRAEIHWNLFEVQTALGIQRRIWKIRWWLRPSLADWMSLSRPDHVSYCIALGSLTQSLWLAGNRDLSRRAGERAVAGLSRRLGDDDPLTLNAMFNLGRTYIHTGDLKQAHQLLSVVLRKRRHLWGPDHTETLMARNELGVCFMNSGTNLAVAERLVFSVLQTRRRVLGEEHAYTLWSVNDLSKVLCKRGRASEAEAMLEEILPIVERTLGRNHVGMIMTKGNLARAHIEAKRWQEAEAIFRELLSSIDSDNHAVWIEVMSGCSRVQMETGRLLEAAETCEKILQRNTQYRAWPADDTRITFVRQRLEEIRNTVACLDT